MTNEKPGKIFRHESIPHSQSRSHRDPEAARILIVDAIVGSRFSIVQAVSQPGIVVETAATTHEAFALLDRERITLVISEQMIGVDDGLEFLVAIRDRYPQTHRALVTSEEGASALGGAVARAGLCFLVSKPFSPGALRKTIRSLLRGEVDAPTWRKRPLARDAASIDRGQRRARLERERRDEILLRGLLAGLNSCERAIEVVELVHSELVTSFEIDRWLWVEHEPALAFRVAGDWPAEGNLSLDSLSHEESRLLARAERTLRATRVDAAQTRPFGFEARQACLGFSITDAGRPALTALVWTEVGRSPALLRMLRELRVGLEMAFRRIRDSEARAFAAQSLAKRVSAELRSPVGALTHAIDRLRGEAARSGLPSEWVDRVSSESERVARAVEHVEGEMLSDAPGIASTSG